MPENEDLDQDLALLNDDSEEIPDETPTPVESEEETLPIKAEEVEEEPKEKEEEEEEDKIEPVLNRPTLTQIKKEYPEFFKRFPEMRHMLFREQEYTKVFPTVDDAKEAREDAENFQSLRELMSNGDKDGFKEFLGGMEKPLLNNLVANFLPSLHALDKDKYFEITTPLVQSFVRHMYNEGVRSGNENLKNAALHASMWGFGDYDYATGKKNAAPPEPKKETSPEREEVNNERYVDLRSAVNGNAQDRLVREIMIGLDPNNVFNPGLQKLLVRQIMDEIGDALQNDQAHMNNMNSLWRRAKQAGYKGEWKDRLLTTYLSRARAILPAIRARAVKEALADRKKANGEKERVAEQSRDRREVPSSQRTPSRSPAPVKAGEVDWSKTSDEDFLNDRITLRR